MSLDNSLEKNLAGFVKEMSYQLFFDSLIVLMEGQRVSLCHNMFARGNYINHLYLFCQFENCTDNIETMWKQKLHVDILKNAA